MRMIYERCCGLDVHKSSIAACALISGKGKTQEETRRFGTMTSELRELAGWLQQKGIRHVAMESTGVYWKPVWNILEPGRLSIMLCLRGSSSLFETGLEHGIQLRKRGKGGTCAGSPAAIFQ